MINQTQYKAWGEERYSSGSKQTNYGYTGQYSYESDFGLHFYNARWYDSSLGRFTQADTIVPSGIQGYDRYAAMENNPVRYTDPTGHFIVPLVVIFVVGAFILVGCAPAPDEVIQTAIDTARSSGDSADYQKAIDAAVDAYDLDVSNMNGGTPIYNPAEVPSGASGRTTNDGSVYIGDDAFKSPDNLIDTIGHENVHATQFAEGRYYEDPIGLAINEIEAYQYMADHTDDFGLSDGFYWNNSHAVAVRLDFLFDKVSPEELEDIQNGNYLWNTPAVPTPSSSKPAFTAR